MEKWIDKIRDLKNRALRPWDQGTEPLEIRRAVLEDAASRVVAAGGGKRVFPFNRVRVHVLAAGPQERDELEAVLREAWDLRTDIAELLREREVRIPPDFDVQVEVTDQPSPAFGDRRFRVEYHRAEGEPAPGGGAPRSTRPVLELTVLKGTAGQHVYTFEGAERVNLGRLEEVLDEDGRLKRRNDVAFVDEGEVSATVSREHARILWDEDSREYRLRREPGASGTRILRDGRPIDVSGQDRRGVRLQAGDEVWLGKACVKVGMR